MKLIKEEVKYQNYRKVILRTFEDENGNISKISFINFPHYSSDNI